MEKSFQIALEAAVPLAFFLASHFGKPEYSEHLLPMVPLYTQFEMRDHVDRSRLRRAKAQMLLKHQWNQGFLKLVEYKKRNNGADPPSHHPQHGNWIMVQR